MSEKVEEQVVQESVEQTEPVVDTPAETPAETPAAEEPKQEEEELSEVKKAALQKKVVQAGGGAVFCVTCEKKSYPAETIYFDQLPYHFNCFSCERCKKKIQGGFDAAVFEHKVYCRGCFAASGFNRLQAQVKWTPKTGSSSTATSGAFAKLGGGGTPCASCTKTVYPAEAAHFEGKPYHTTCLICSQCNARCTLNNVSQFEDNLYCAGCWRTGGFARKQLELKQNEAKKSGNYSAITLKLGGGGNPCAACAKTVYSAEAMHFEGKPYHPDCLACSECRVKCTLSQVNQYEGSLYCTKCWQHGGFNKKQLNSASKWQAKEVDPNAYAGTISAKFGNANTIKCTTCEKTVYPAEQLVYEGNSYHPVCFKCTHCSQRIPTVNNAQHNKKQPYCQRCFNELELYRADKA